MSVFKLCRLLSSVNDVIVEPESLEDKESDDAEDIEGQISRLWVDRFSPRHYTELLSDDVSFVLCVYFHASGRCLRNIHN